MCGARVRDRRCPIILVTLRLSTFPTTPYHFWRSYKEANSDSPLFLSDHILHEHLENNTTMSHEESVPDAHSNPAAPGGEQTGLSSPEQASPSLVIENPSGPSSTAAVARQRKLHLLDRHRLRPIPLSSILNLFQHYLRSTQQRYIYPCRRATTRGLSEITGPRPCV